MKRALSIVVPALLFAGLFLPRWVDLWLNRTPGGYAPVSERARAVFSGLEIADLHADALLWGRPLLERSGRGAVDVPRLIEGRVALQVFGVVTSMPRHLSGSNDGATDWIRILSWAAWWPRRTHASLAERALYQAGRLAQAAEDSRGRLTLIRTAADLSEYLKRRSTEPDLTAGLLAVEGAQALEGNLDNLDRFYAAGVRMMSPTHFVDTEIGGSAHGMGKGGLTPLGRQWLIQMQNRRMIVDVAHASPATIDDVLSLAKRPVVVSHTGVRATCDNQRNLSDGQLEGVRKNGGLVGIGYWKMAVCGTGADAVARAIRHAVLVAGVEHVALGSDFDGAVAVPFDAAHLDALVDALLRQGLSEAEIRRVMGENALEFFANNLP